MSKIILDSVASGYDLSKVNANFQKIEDELNDKVLYRNNPVGEPNALITDVDVNGKSLYNLPTPTLEHQAVPKGYADDVINIASDYADAAAISAAAALVSENNAASSESNAASSEANALASANAAALSEANAAASELAAATSESNAALSESNAAISEANALASENAAALSESNALASENAAALSESNAALSESNSAASALAASNSADDAYAAQLAAEAAQAATEAIALSAPDVTLGDPDDFVQINALGDGWDYLSPSEVATEIGAVAVDATATFTNKTISLTNNTITGTASEFDTACSDDNFLFASDIGTSVQAYDADIPTVVGTSAEIVTGTETAVRSWAPDQLKAAITSLDTNDKAKVSANDTTAGYLNGKLVAGTGITLTEGNDGGNETLTIASSTTGNVSTTYGTLQATTTGTAFDVTSIPSTVFKIDILFSGISVDAASIITLQIGDSGGIETSGYSGTSATVATDTLYSVGFNLHGAGTAADVLHGIATLERIDSTSNLWAFSIRGGRSNTAGVISGGGTKALSDTLDRFRLTSVSGTANFDAGSFNYVLWSR